MYIRTSSFVLLACNSTRVCDPKCNTHKVGNNGINANFVFPKICSFLHYYRPQRSWAKVIFSQACVKNSVHGGVSASVHAGIHPPGTRPPGSGRPPGDQTPHPPEPGRPPPGKQTAAYGQRAAGTDPTGMHSCFRL